MPFLAFLAMLTGALAAGWAFRPALAGRRESAAFRAVLCLVAGILLIHGVLAWLDLAGLPWYATVVAGIVAAVAILGRRVLARRAPPVETAGAPGLALGWAAVVGGAIGDPIGGDEVKCLVAALDADDVPNRRRVVVRSAIGDPGRRQAACPETGTAVRPSARVCASRLPMPFSSFLEGGPGAMGACADGWPGRSAERDREG